MLCIKHPPSLLRPFPSCSRSLLTAFLHLFLVSIPNLWVPQVHLAVAATLDLGAGSFSVFHVPVWHGWMGDGVGRCVIYGRFGCVGGVSGLFAVVLCLCACLRNLKYCPRSRALHTVAENLLTAVERWGDG